MGQWLWDVCGVHMLVPMPLLTRDHQRVAAPPGTSTARCKVSVVAEATAQTEYALPPSKLLPYDDHFHPRTRGPGAQSSRPESRRLGHPLIAANVIPYENQVRMDSAAVVIVR